MTGADIIPLANPAMDLAPLREKLVAAAARVIERGSYVLGSEVAGFEQRMASRLGVLGTVGVASGTDALVLALLALGVGPGQEVITVSHTAGPTVAAIRVVGAIPVLVEVEPDTFCLDPKALDAAVGPLTKAVIAVHLYGHPAALDDICEFARQRGLSVIEDCAQAQEATMHGRMVGSIGDIGCFSFYPTKNLGAIGDGGLVAARDQRLVERVRHLRTYGWTKSQYAEIPYGRCSRLDELQAAMLAVKLDHLSEQIGGRRAIARAYDEAFANLPLLRPIERFGCRHVYHLYVIRCQQRDALARHLENSDIMTGRHYPFPVHEQPGLAFDARIPRVLTVTEQIKQEILTLPLYPSMSIAQQTRVINAVCSFFEKS
jgi:dTDP-4-amino-4,6-dideoxygalactose transaminase